MWNPFKTSLHSHEAMNAGAHEPVANNDQNMYGDPQEMFVAPNGENLDDANYSDQTGPGPMRGQLGDAQSNVPDYAEGLTPGGESRSLIWSPGPVHGYAFLPNSQSTRQDVGSVPGNAELNIHNGPVDGSAMDVFQTGNVVPTAAEVPGYHGPVGNTEPDYATRAAYANFQNAFANVSTQAATDASIGAI